MKRFMCPDSWPARAGRALVIIVSLLAFAVRVQAQPMAQVRNVNGARAAVPYVVGEELTFHATFGKLPAGSAHMRVEGIDTVRGRAAYHVVFSVNGGIPLFRVRDRFESWIDVETLSSLRYRQVVAEGHYHRTTNYELYPERAEYQKNDEPPQPSVSNPLDEGSFIYAVRSEALHAGDTVRNTRYFMPNKNPVVLIGVREDTITVGAGRYVTTVIHPTIKASGIFSENGEAEIWFSNDQRHLPVQVKTRFSRFSLTLSLESVTVGDTTVRSLARR